MIKINLLGDSTVIDHSKKVEFFGYVATLALGLAVCVALYMQITSTKATLEARVNVLEQQLAALKEQTKEVKDLEKMKQEVASKLEVISTLRKNKRGPVRVLDDLNNSLPEKSWVTTLDERDSNLMMTGVALDNQTIATFMQELEKSEYYETVDLEETKQGEVDGVGVKNFSLRAKISYAGASNVSNKEPKSEESASQPGLQNAQAR